jgi:hypothetical protein
MKTITLIFLVAASLRADSTLWDSSRDGVREVTLTLSEGAFTEEHLDELARMELARTPRASFIKLTMVGAKGGLPGPRGASYGFADWLRLYDPSRPNEIAEMIANGDDAVLRVRDLSGKLTERVLSGKNPLSVTVGGENFQIVYLSIGVAVAYGGEVRVFFRTASTLRTQAGEALMRALQPSFPSFRISVLVQNDPWFVREGDYPIVNPFVENKKPPTPEEYLQIKTLTCRYADGPPTCGVNFIK